MSVSDCCCEVFSSDMVIGSNAALVAAYCISRVVKDYRTTVKHCRELERNVKAQKYKMSEYV